MLYVAFIARPWSRARVLVLMLPSADCVTSTRTFLFNEAPHSPPLIEGLLVSIMFRDIKSLEEGPAENTSSVLLLL